MVRTYVFVSYIELDIPLRCGKIDSFICVRLSFTKPNAGTYVRTYACDLIRDCKLMFGHNNLQIIIIGPSNSL